MIKHVFFTILLSVVLIVLNLSVLPFIVNIESTFVLYGGLVVIPVVDYFLIKLWYDKIWKDLSK